MIYADIIIDISLEALDRVFQYMIPEEMLPDISVGSQVMVPFGKGNRQILGYVIGFSTIPDYDPAKMKYIHEIKKDALIVEAQMIRLASYL